MAIQNSVQARNARLDSFETVCGASPKLRIYSGSKPANCAASATGTLLVEIALPSDWLNAASNGVKTKKGTWSGSGVANGVAGYYRIYNSGGSTCHEQGTVTVTGGGGDMTLDNTNIANGQNVTIADYSRTAGNA